jgi:hypothetical protein
MGGKSWIDEELAGSQFRDLRLGQRLRTLMTQLAGAVGAPIPLACQDWANTKAAYRFLSNPDVSEREILDGHFHATASRAAAVEGPVLVLQDTTEFSFQRTRPEAIGAIGYAPSRRGDDGRFRLHTVCGLLMHSSLAITQEGLPLGLAAIRFWSRAKFKGSAALKRHVNPTRVPIEAKESMRWLANMQAATMLLGAPDRLIHIGDRENDIYEFFCATQEAGTEAGTHFLVRHASTDSRAVVGTPLPPKWPRSRWPVITGSRSATGRRPRSRCATSAFTCCRRSASRNGTLRST